MWREFSYLLFTYLGEDKRQWQKWGGLFESVNLWALILHPKTSLTGLQVHSRHPSLRVSHQPFPICHRQICNFSSQSKMPGLPWYFINDLQITAQQKMGTQEPQCVLRLQHVPFLSTALSQADRFLWKMWLVSRVIVCVQYVQKCSPE